MANDDSRNEFPPTKQSGPRRRRGPLRHDLLGQPGKKEETLTVALHPVPEEMLNRFRKLGDTAPLESPNKTLSAPASHPETSDHRSNHSPSELLERLGNSRLGTEDAIAQAVGILCELLPCKLACFLFPHKGSEQWVVLSSMGQGAGRLLLKQVTLPEKTISLLDETLPAVHSVDGISFDVQVSSGKSSLFDYSAHQVLLLPLPLKPPRYALMTMISTSGQEVFGDEAKTLATEVQSRLRRHLAQME
jgi:hypothetical protein